jgi:hypothetical protein
MKAALTGFALLVALVACSTLPAQYTAAGPSKWEYRVFTKVEVLDLGNKDLTTGLNKLGEEGWELAAIDSAYIFKRPKGLTRQQAEAALKERITLAEADVDQWKERLAWVTRMARKGFLTEQQLETDKAKLEVAEKILDRARRELGGMASPKEPEKLPKPKDR